MIQVHLETKGMNLKRRDVERQFGKENAFKLLRRYWCKVGGRELKKQKQTQMRIEENNEYKNTFLQKA